MFEVECIKHIILPIEHPKAFWIAALGSYETQERLLHKSSKRVIKLHMFLC